MIKINKLSFMVIVTIINSYPTQVSATNPSPVTPMSTLATLITAAYATSSTAHTVHNLISIALQPTTPSTILQKAQTHATLAIQSTIANVNAELATSRIIRKPESSLMPAACQQTVNAVHNTNTIAATINPSASTVTQVSAACSQVIAATGRAITVSKAIPNQTVAEKAQWKVAESHYMIAIECQKSASIATTPLAKIICYQAAAASCLAAIAHVFSIGTKQETIE